MHDRLAVGPFRAARRAVICCAMLFGIAVLSALAGSAAACDTPVYRYAMYRWEPAPYEVYHFHHGEMDKRFADAKAKLAAARDDKAAPANVAVYPVNLDEDKELKTVPRDVRRIWQAKEQAGVQTPATVVVNPLGFEVHTGGITAADVAALANSPARKQIGGLLSQGHAGVYVLVLGKDEQLNKTAAAAVDKLIADVNSGKLSLYAGPDPYDPFNAKVKVPQQGLKQDAPQEDVESDGKQNAKPADAKKDGDADSEQPAEAKKPPHSVACLKFARDDLQAKDPWLYRELMAVENDLHEFQDEPMLFVVYGRGRALPPYIGKGIDYDNLVEITEFITGACSCTVKDQNPGVDLLMAFDWESAAAEVSKRFGSEEGNNASLTDLFPQLIVPGGAEIDPPRDETVQPEK